MGKLTLARVTKSYHSHKVIEPTDLTIEDGEFVVFVGPSGCGKSSMLRMIAGLEDITNGTLEIDGKVVNDLPPIERGISMVFQSYALYPHLSVFENIAFPLRVAGLDKATIRSRVESAARTLKLEARLDHKPGALSGGQRQRVAIGRAIVREPDVFLFDEPLSNLDAALRGEMRVELSRLHKTLRNTIIYVTHDQVEAMTLADRIVVMRAGRIEQVGTPLELYHHPANRFVAEFIGTPAMNFLPVTSLGTSTDGVRVRLEDGTEVTLPVDGDSPAGETLHLGIRPIEFRVDGEGVGVTLVPDVVERLGAITEVHAFDKGGRLHCVTGSGTMALPPAQEFLARFHPEDAHLFRTDGSALHRRFAKLDEDLRLV
ncbi:ABC transporter ATP-binding protein [Celeribacter indicus]|uniref:Putative sugar ABC transporter, ATP-binding protein n=1 Tax=Celeribacter indicus TaxID=1208324 RepID=A0A0B5DZ75_9RHOB|nr:sn-glycerol-3-phosphate ABC transporter ATP-binding protein UgpC [Celeribacter indicus]AJE48718.1 putative sugar ABC transporter, ATP-binding protein [Celeribacter indicus]